MIEGKRETWSCCPLIIQEWHNKSYFTQIIKNCLDLSVRQFEKTCLICTSNWLNMIDALKKTDFHQAIHWRLKIEAPNIGSLDEVKTRGGMSSICRWSSNSVCTRVWSSWLSFLFFFKYLHQDENACSWRWHVTEGRVWLPNPNGLWLPPALIFGKLYCNFFEENFWKKTFIKVQNLQYKFGDSKLPSPPFGTFLKIHPIW